MFDYFCNTVSYHNPLFTFFIHKCFHINVFFNFIHICKTSHILPENWTSDIASTSLPLSLFLSPSLLRPSSTVLACAPFHLSNLKVYQLLIRKMLVDSNLQGSNRIPLKSSSRLYILLS